MADAHFEEAVRQARRADSPPWLADALVHHASALLRRGGDQARTCAESLLTEAISTCDRLGIDALGRLARSLRS